VRIDDDSAGDPVCRAEHDIPGFSRDSRQREDLLHRARHLPANFSRIALPAPITDFVLLRKNPVGPDFLLQFAGRGVRERLRVRIFLVKRFGNLIHAHVPCIERKEIVEISS